MRQDIAQLVERLAGQAEAVCRRYLSAGRREGDYWRVGDVANTPGRSLYVRLRASGSRAAGRWADAATGEHGDLLDLIAASRELTAFGEVLREARRFLSLPSEPVAAPRSEAAPPGSSLAARRLFAAAKPLLGTPAQRYLASRGIVLAEAPASLRYHPNCWYRTAAGEPPSARRAWPALIAAAVNCDGVLTGVHRTWLDPFGCGKAPVTSPRRALGRLTGSGVRVGVMTDSLAVGEGLETLLSVRIALPALPVLAAGSAAHLRALQLPQGLRRLYIAEDGDAPGRAAAAVLATRAQAVGLDALPLCPTLGDFNDDLVRLGPTALRASLRPQLAPEDVARYLRCG